MRILSPAILFLSLVSVGHGQSSYQPVKTGKTIGTQFEQYTTKDSLGRTITFYLSKSASGEKLPVILFIPGSGRQSLWIVKDGKTYGGLQNLLLSAAKGRARILAVEKPGIAYGFQPPRPGSAEGCPKEFLEEHTLDRWSEANKAALLATLSLDDVAKEQVLVAGHSEGGIVAAKVAAETSRVTHVANMAGGGPNQLYDLLQMMPQDQLSSHWAEIMKDPASTEKLWLGHPYRRWSTFCAASPIEFLSKFNGRIYAVQGTADKNVAPNTFDILSAEMRGRGKDFTGVKVEGGDHGFQVAGDQSTGFQVQFQKLVDWFLAAK